MKKYIGIDIGGTFIKYGIIKEDSTILVREEMPTEAYKGGSSILMKVEGIVEKYIEGNDISGICISSAGMVDTEEGVISYSGKQIPDYAGIQFKKILEDKFGIPCEIENDVNCAGLAESISGAAKHSRIVLCLTIGTGIGGCIVMDKKVYHGFSNSACEVGYMNMLGSDFQTLGAVSELSARVAEQKSGTKEYWSGKRIFEAIRLGDEICTVAVDEMADVLGYGIANICYVINPQTIVLGGGIMAEGDYLYPRISKALEKYLIPDIFKRTTVKIAQHRNDAGMLGAFYHFDSCREKRICMRDKSG